MKAFVKYALASVALAAAGGAYADVTIPSTGNGELALFVHDLSSPTRSFMIGLGFTVDDLITDAQVGATPGDAATLRNGQPIVRNVSLPSFSSSTLASFMSQPSASGYEYAIIGGDTDTDGSVNNPLRFAFTGELQYTSTVLSNVPMTFMNSTAGNMDSFFDENNLILGGAASTDSSTFAQGGTAGSTAQVLFNANVDDTASVGTATNLYVLTSGGASNSRARIYQFADVKLTLDGNLTSTSVAAVPLPAAVWLLGSALVGFGTVRRRRNAEVAA
ncbi:MAG: VPLPA-CTERM sorting domain-containing protein [Gammaproteobacteria bacterium]